MSTVKLQILDEVKCKFVNLSPEIRQYLHKKSKIFNPQNRYVPSFRMGRWDGKTAYFSMGGDTYINLLEPMLEFLYDKNISVEIEDFRKYNRNFSFDSIDCNYFSCLNWPEGHQKAGEPIVLREHQVEAINIMLNNIQGIAQLPTGSGKTAIVSILSHKVEKYGRSIVIVPNKDLIEQTENYYKLFGLDVGVFYGDKKQFFHKHTICTWQSLEKLRESPIDIGADEPITFEKYMDGVVAVICDEVHSAKATILSNLLTRELAHIPIRWGLTGTIPKEEFEMINLTISIGSIIHRLATIDLQDSGILSTCEVKIAQLIDSKSFLSYTDEYEYLVTDPKRLEYISSLITEVSKNGNVLILVGRKETGRILESLIPDSVFISGATKSSTRKEHYDEVKLSNEKILIATAAIAAVGIDIPRLNALVLFECGKSFVRTIQSVGRVLRTSFDKNHAIILDICSTCKFSKRHLTNRKRYYEEQKFPYTLNKIVWE